MYFRDWQLLYFSVMGLKTFYIESYGCQMNFNDSEIIASILSDAGYALNRDYRQVDLILLNTCSIREKAEEHIRKRIAELSVLKKHKKDLLIGILGCMAERLKQRLLEEERVVDLVVGPDAYKSLPILVAKAEGGQKAVNVLLSREETYADLTPIRLNSNGVTAFVSIMRGCNNMCTFCIVPFTRGRERSRPVDSILRECRELFYAGYREVTLLGQNVDSYCYTQGAKPTSFAELLILVAQIDPRLRVRFSTSHPKDITDEVLFAMRDYQNICPYIHLPAQSGSSQILNRMRRTYDRDWYLAKFARIREILPHCAISTDLIAGFCGETEADHRDTLSLMEICRFDLAYMFQYSERPGTPAAKQFVDDVAPEVKQRRLQEIIALHRQHALEGMHRLVGTVQEVLIEGDSKKDANAWKGRTPDNRMVVFAKDAASKLGPGDYIQVSIDKATSATLLGKIVSCNAKYALV